MHKYAYEFLSSEEIFALRINVGISIQLSNDAFYSYPPKSPKIYPNLWTKYKSLTEKTSSIVKLLLFIK